MKAIYFNEYGPASVLQYGEQPTPKPKANQILVRVQASSVNPVDWKIREGGMKLIMSPAFPKLMGRDVAGEVAAVGDDVVRFTPGDRVYGMVAGMGGANAEYAVLEEVETAFIPDNLGFEQAAAVPLVAITALQALRDHAPVLSGDRVLINGASGGVGAMAVQIAWALGAGEVIGTCGPDNMEMVRSLGASQVYNYKEHDFTKDQSRYDVVFDAAGKSSFLESKACLRNNGRYVTTIPDPKAIAAAVLSAAFSSKKQAAFMAKNSGSDMALISAWLKAGTIHPVIDRTFPLSETSAAQEYGEQGESKGKIVLTVG
ncbi:MULTISPECIES: NADP-dependent oxidoreductase [Hymenobacter]|uniref:NADP-dependent oxidoreductase n=2 Tax=Hymenobacter TaxID=89966 RepID=A0ABS6X221_9BACT|nr:MULTISPECIES: NADP-dependent oxidoreductase [Hymenobacter]MBO3271797.1 NADP-dependent oxidoreductase [Hymenobacter defluvii]MBW3129709.1 NADP-dependent oxidoreductase [Hymenobacter profundi]